MRSKKGFILITKNRHTSGADPSKEAAQAYEAVGTYNIVAVSAKNGTQRSSVMIGKDKGYQSREVRNMHFVEYVLQDLSSCIDFVLGNVRVSKKKDKSMVSIKMVARDRDMVDILFADVEGAEGEILDLIMKANEVRSGKCAEILCMSLHFFQALFLRLFMRSNQSVNSTWKYIRGFLTCSRHSHRSTQRSITCPFNIICKCNDFIKKARFPIQLQSARRLHASFRMAQLWQRCVQRKILHARLEGIVLKTSSITPTHFCSFIFCVCFVQCCDCIRKISDVVSRNLCD